LEEAVFIFKVRTFHKELRMHETFFFMTIPTVSEVVSELLKMKPGGNRTSDYISMLVENVRKSGMPVTLHVAKGGSAVMQWHYLDGLHLGYLDIEPIKVNENHHQPHEPEQQELT